MKNERFRFWDPNEYRMRRGLHAVFVTWVTVAGKGKEKLFYIVVKMVH